MMPGLVTRTVASAIHIPLGLLLTTLQGWAGTSQASQPPPPGLGEKRNRESGRLGAEECLFIIMMKPIVRWRSHSFALAFLGKRDFLQPYGIVKFIYPICDLDDHKASKDGSIPCLLPC